jgi:hypothetical protein
MLLISFLGGLTNKLYDDLNDNCILNHFRNDIFLEYLKGIHFISFTSVSIEDPLFFIFLYTVLIVNRYTNCDAYTEPYEKSLFYSFLLIFVILDYTKITNIGLFDKISLIMFCITMGSEPVCVKNIEHSFLKLITRIIGLIGTTLICLFGTYNTTKHVFSYCAGYYLMSVLVQYYSLINNEKITNNVTNNVTNDIATDVTNDVTNNVTNDVATDVATNVATDVATDVTTDVANETGNVKSVISFTC